MRFDLALRASPPALLTYPPSHISSPSSLAGAPLSGGGGGGGGGAAGGIGDSPAPWTSARLRTSLVESGRAVDESFVRRVILSRALQASLSFCTSAADVADFYDMVCAEPQSETRANVLHESGVTIDGDIYVPHRSTALFKWAFDGMIPSVLKLPQARGAAARECRLYDELGADARAAGVHLVPVRLITMRGSHRVGADVTSLNAGILMPAYPVTLALVPRALLLSHGAYMLELLQAAVDFLFARGWVHGDVKPSNIFLSGVDGLPWLGDFGSSVRTAEVRAGFQGGTPHFQLEGVAADAPDASFDRAGLVVSFVEALGLLSGGSRDSAAWPRAVVSAAVGRVEDGGLRAGLEAALARIA